MSTPSKPTPAPFAINVHWLNQTFTSPTRTDALLRPELDSGTLSYPDFDRARSFLPKASTLSPYYSLYAPLAAAGVGAYARLRPGKAPWPIPKSLGLMLFASLIGYGFGQARRASAFYKFAKSLENPVGFARALSNIRDGRSGVASTGAESPEVQEGAEVDKFKAGPEEVWTARASTVPHVQPSPHSHSQSPSPPSQSPTSRWAQIRTLNSRTAPPSSWETIRQQTSTSPSTTTTTPFPSPSPPDDFTPRQTTASDDRAAEKAHFDAMLDAERRAASGGA